MTDFPEDIGHFARTVDMPDFWPCERVEEGRWVMWGEGRGRLVAESGAEGREGRVIEDKCWVKVFKQAGCIDTRTVWFEIQPCTMVGDNEVGDGWSVVRLECEISTSNPIWKRWRKSGGDEFDRSNI